MRKFIGTAVSFIVAVIGFAWGFPNKALTLIEHVMTLLHLPGDAAEISRWFQSHPDLLSQIGPWVLVGGGILSLLAIHLWPVLNRYLNPLEFYLEPDIRTGLLGLQSFPGRASTYTSQS